MKKLFLPIGALALYSSAVAQQQSDRPNVLLIYADDIGYGDLSCNGTSAVRTPNVEKLASEGIRFTNAHCAAATSTPSRYAMLTGEYAWRRKGTGIAAGNAAMIITPDRGLTNSKDYQQTPFKPRSPVRYRQLQPNRLLLQHSVPLHASADS